MTGTDATLDGTRTKIFTALGAVLLQIMVALGRSKLPPTAAKDLLKVIMRRQRGCLFFEALRRRALIPREKRLEQDQFGRVVQRAPDLREAHGFAAIRTQRG